MQRFVRMLQYFFPHESKKKSPSKVSHNRPKIIFSSLPTDPKPAQILDMKSHKFIPQNWLPTRLLYNDFACCVLK